MQFVAWSVEGVGNVAEELDVLVLGHLLRIHQPERLDEVHLIAIEVNWRADKVAVLFNHVADAILFSIFARVGLKN